MLTSDRRKVVIGRNPRRMAMREPRRIPQGSLSRPTAPALVRASMLTHQIDRSKPADGRRLTED
ncbi:hypothetical protein [Selenomonas sp. ND2010]|uniref:hypothetical protein n=1 Tax=Selenomonas sp. ND2010 TaxID=1410618 RepID=UPI0012DED9F2|nr:hypothetical protein [Selenomonas sp. ND2010]